jgi:hypothetical protein
MATKHNRFIWSEDKKDWLKTWQPGLRRNVNRFSKQLSLFKQVLPDFAQEAEIAARPYLESGWLLLHLSWKNKFNPLSPESAEAKLSRLNESLASWTDFTSRPDVARAVAGVNAKVQNDKRERQEALRNSEQAFLAYTNSDQFTEDITKMAATVMEKIQTVTAVAMDLSGHGTPEDLPLLERLCLVQYIRMMHEFNPRVREAVAQYLSTNASGTMRDLLSFTLRSVIIETTRGHLQRPDLFVPDVNDAKLRIIVYLGRVGERLVALTKQWKESGVTPVEIDREFFTVQGVDFSLDVKPF